MRELFYYFSMTKTVNLLKIIPSMMIVLFMSCSSEEYSSPLKGQTVETQLVEAAGAGNIHITIGNKDLSNCKIISNATWCIVTVERSYVNIYRVEPNDTYDERQATITLTDMEDATTISFQVVQKQKDVILVENDTFDVPEEGGTITIPIKSNVDYDIELPSGNWITIAPGTRGLEEKELNLVVAYNNSGSERDGIVKIVGKNSKANAVIKIKQALTPRIEVEGERVTVNSDGGEVTVKVKSNVDVNRITSDSEWVKLGMMSKEDGFNFSIKLTISPMTIKGTRFAYIRFYSDTKQYNYILQVSQTGISDNVVSCYVHTLSYISGYYGSLSAQAHIKNDTKSTIYLTSVTMKTLSHTILSQNFDSKELAPGKSTYVDYNGTYIEGFSIIGLCCTWTYYSGGKEYTITGYEK